MVETASTTLMTRPTAAAPPEPTAEGRTMRLPGSAVVDRAVEVALGLVLATGFLPRITLLVLAGHLAGTFLSFVTASELMWGANSSSSPRTASSWRRTWCSSPRHSS